MASALDATRTMEAGVMDGEELFTATAGTPQGGVISPSLANVALHGLETVIIAQRNGAGTEGE
jgi:retron-type reverse transcriptase